MPIAAPRRRDLAALAWLSVLGLVSAQTAPPPAPVASGGAAADLPLSSGYDDAVTRLPDFMVEGRQYDLVEFGDPGHRGER
jgi:hypothetical protein